MSLMASMVAWALYSSPVTLSAAKGLWRWLAHLNCKGHRQHRAGSHLPAANCCDAGCALHWTIHHIRSWHARWRCACATLLCANRLDPGRCAHLWQGAQGRSPPTEAGNRGCSCDASPPASWAALAQALFLRCLGTMCLAAHHLAWAASPPQEGLLPRRHGGQPGQRSAGQPWHIQHHNALWSFCRHCKPPQGGLKGPVALTRL